MRSTKRVVRVATSSLPRARSAFYQGLTQKLHAFIAAIREEVAAGRVGRALSMCNQALTEIDSATDVVSPSQHLKERAGLEANYAPQSGK
jgi:hypothetical protein